MLGGHPLPWLVGVTKVPLHVATFARRHDFATLDWPRRASDPFLNVNTPVDLARAEAMLRER